MAKVIAELIKGRELKPGDLFSTAGPNYWNLALDKGSIGERVYVRTNTPADMTLDADEDIYRITIIPTS